MTITTQRDGSHITLVIAGRVDTNTSTQLQGEILRAFQGARQLTLDFSQVSYISSAGLRALLIGQKTALTKGASMELIHLQPAVMTVLSLSGFDSILNIK